MHGDGQGSPLRLRRVRLSEVFLFAIDAAAAASPTALVVVVVVVVVVDDVCWGLFLVRLQASAKLVLDGWVGWAGRWWGGGMTGGGQ